jgi:hypothetical protein
MRWVVVACALVLVSATAVARAKIVIMEPAIVRQCPHAPTWDGIEKCLKKLGKPTVLRSLPGARVVRLDQKSGDADFDIGVSLYVDQGKQWKLAGLYEAHGTEYELLAAEPLTVGKHTGYRLEVGEMLRTAVSLDGVTSTPALFTMRRVMFCGGDAWRCPEVITACDVLVRGAALWAFRGAITIADNKVTVKGDRSITGSFCSVPEQTFLGWSQP